jgi:hypothetical protein
LFCLAWFVGLTLTKQKIQLEAMNKIKNLTEDISPFRWDFNSFTADIVQPYQKYWHRLADNSISAEPGSDPILSLNFSGEVINTAHHLQMVIESSQPLTATLTIQFKSKLDDGLFYYSSAIKLFGKKQYINLDRVWQNRTDQQYSGVNFPWGGDLQQVSSLVLYFNNPNAAINIDKISMPYQIENRQQQRYNVDCLGNILDSQAVNNADINIFQITTDCLLPSNYLWLQQYLQHQYPESIFSIQGLKLWQQTVLHKVNKSYAGNSLHNTILYGIIFIITLIVAYLTKHYAVDQAVNNNKNSIKQNLKRLLFRGGREVLKPHHLTINYLFVLMPTFLLAIILIIIKLPVFEIFKSIPNYFVWALFQQFVLGFILAEVIFYRQLQNRILSALLAGFIFSLFHMPSLMLMVVTFLAGSFWAYSWLLFKRLIPLAISHAVLAILFYSVISERLLFSAKILHWYWQ